MAHVVEHEQAVDLDQAVAIAVSRHDRGRAAAALAGQQGAAGIGGELIAVKDEINAVIVGIVQCRDLLISAEIPSTQGVVNGTVPSRPGIVCGQLSRCADSLRFWRAIRAHGLPANRSAKAIARRD